MVHGASARFAPRVSATCILHRCITHCTLRAAHGAWRGRTRAFCFARLRIPQRASLHWRTAHQRRAPASSIKAAHQASAPRAARVTHRASLVAERLVLRINTSRVSASRIKAPCAAHCASHTSTVHRHRALPSTCCHACQLHTAGAATTTRGTAKLIERSDAVSATAPASSSRQQLCISAPAIVIAGVCG